MAILREQFDFEKDNRLKPAVKQLIKQYLNLAKSSEALNTPFSIPNHVSDTAVASVYITQNLNKPEFAIFNKDKYKNGLIDAVEKSVQHITFGKDSLGKYRDSFKDTESREALLNDVIKFDKNDAFTGTPIFQIAGFITNNPEPKLVGSISSSPTVEPEYTNANAVIGNEKPQALESKLKILDRYYNRSNNYVEVFKTAREIKIDSANGIKPDITQLEYNIRLKAQQQYLEFINENNIIAGNNKSKQMSTGRGFGTASALFVGEELRQIVKSEGGKEHEIIIGHFNPISNTYSMPAKQENNTVAYEAQALAFKMTGAKKAYFNSVPEPLARGENYIIKMHKALEAAGIPANDIVIPKKYAHLVDQLKGGSISSVAPVEDVVEKTIEAVKANPKSNVLDFATPKPEPKAVKEELKAKAEPEIRKLPNDMFLLENQKRGPNGAKEYSLYAITGKSKLDKASVIMAVNQFIADDPKLKDQIKSTFQTAVVSSDRALLKQTEKPCKEILDTINSIKNEVTAAVKSESLSKPEPTPEEKEKTAQIQKEAMEKMKVRGAKNK
ncbi:hypothetical protein [Pseudomonas syringae]|uniref:hypothetical protein n=1 Tax=Pseudomonas syringae TaxID=317 RepID=UPI000A1DFB5F|nr:hypothetical protein [Pseudomonas syringae]OSO49019.1 hypothetical protein BV364_00029 [Pseudomonas syringae pv. actinidiae]